MIIGEIHRGPEGEAPTFKVIRHDYGEDARAVRPCNHSGFILDTKWSTITCKKCGERVDPFAAMLHYAQWWEHLERRRADAEEAERRLHTTHLRALRKRRAATPQQLTDIDAAIGSYKPPPLPELANLAARIEREQHDSRGRG